MRLSIKCIRINRWIELPLNMSTSGFENNFSLVVKFRPDKIYETHDLCILYNHDTL